MSENTREISREELEQASGGMTEPPPAENHAKHCPHCGKSMTFISSLQKWHCKHCNKYYK